MQSGDREQFDVLLAEIFASLDKPLTETKREVFWRGLAKMRLPELARVRDRLLERLESGETPRTFSVADCWSIKHELRARGPIEHAPRETIPAMDSWTACANRHLLAYIRRRLGTEPRAYGASLSEEQAKATAILVAYKNAWAQDMREIADARNAVPVQQQRDAWVDCMQRAEAEIARTLRPKALTHQRAAA